ncbi:hypothetical protein B0H19DRAFT_1276830 [Mycena capillaripes]|nr:hypothetical protein B0H19DRAFT_1276830 [Mycena capillaripes]
MNSTSAKIARSVSNSQDTMIAHDAVEHTGGLLKLANEILANIVILSSPNYFEEPAAFIQHRANILYVCRRLYLVVIGCPSMWSSYAITTDLKRTELQTMTHHISNRSLKLKLLFVGEVQPPSFPDRTSFSETMDFFQAHVTQYTMLDFELHEFQQTSEMLDYLLGATFEQLDHVTFAWYGERLRDKNNDVISFDLPFTGNELHNVGTLRLYDMRFRWESITKFTGLTTLVLNYLYGELRPSVEHLAAILRGNPKLRRTSLRLCVGSRAADQPVRAINLPDLMRLDLDFKGPSSIIQLMGQCQMPQMEILHFDFATHADIDLFFAFVRNSPAITFMSISGRAINTSTAIRILRALPSVSNLDISFTNGHVFKEAIASYSDHEGPLCPSLETISVIEFKTSDIFNLLSGRNRMGHGLKGVNSHQGYPDHSEGSYAAEDVTQREYIKSHLDAFNEDPDPTEQEAASWCFL